MGTINKTIVKIEAPVVEAPEISGALETELKVYSNADTDKLQILSDNKGKAGIYQWTHKESGKKYIGSAIDLSKRLKHYYSYNYISSHRRNMTINKALLKYSYSSFSFLILLLSVQFSCNTLYGITLYSRVDLRAITNNILILSIL